MEVSVVGGPSFVTEALFGLGLSYGLTSERKIIDLFNDTELRNRLKKIALKLANKQGGHNKFLETITMTLDIRAPRYWWQEFDTYRVGVTKQSESTMHTITKRALTSDDFEGGMADVILHSLNSARVAARALQDDERMLNMKRYLPESFLQRRIVCLNARTLQNMYLQRKDHKLPEWQQFFSGVQTDLFEKIAADAQFVYECVFGDNK